MKHQDWQDLIPFYVARTLSPDELTRFEAHLAGCETCQQEIDEWRTIASAVWRDAEIAARSLPPLSPKIYDHIQQREQSRPTQVTTVSPLAEMPDNVRRLPQQSSRVPLTLVAGIVVAVLFGGLLFGLAVRQTDPADNTEIILMNSTGDALTQGAAMGINGNNPIASMTPRPTDMGIIPTMAEATDTNAPPLFMTNTPVSVPEGLPSDLPFNPDVAAAVGGGGDETASQADMFNPTVFPTPVQVLPTNTPDILQVAPLGSGPHITLTPNMFDVQGRALCELYNPTNVAIELYERADRNSQIVMTIIPGDMMLVVGRSNTGWYLVENVSGMRAWLQASFAYLIGNCDVSIPIATVQPTATRLAPSLTPQANIATPSLAREVVVSAAFADLYSGPTFDSTVLGVVNRDERFTVLGYQGTGTNRWVMVQLPDGASAWLWASIVTEETP